MQTPFITNVASYKAKQLALPDCIIKVRLTMYKPLRGSPANAIQHWGRGTPSLLLHRLTLVLTQSIDGYLSEAGR